MGLFGNGKNKEDKKKNKILQKAQKFARKGQIDKAVAEWQSLLKNKADDANVYNTIGDLYLKGNQKEKSIEAYRQASGIYSSSGFALKAIAVNKKVLKIDPHDLDSLGCMAKLNQERGMVKNAKECYLSIAETHIRSGAHDKALEAYQHIVDMEPRNIKVKLNLADLYLKEKMVQEGTKIYGDVISTFLEHEKFDEAEKVCNKLEQSVSSSQAVLRYMVQIHLAREHLDQAFECFKDLEGHVDEDPELALLEAEMLIRKGETEEGLSLIESIDRGAVTEYSRLKIFRYLLKAKKADQALDVLNDLADDYSKTKRLDELLSLYRLIVEHDADHLTTRHRLVDLLKKMKRDQDVILQYKEMGRIYAASGQLDEAQNIYEKILDITPGDMEVQASLSALKGEPAPIVGVPDYGEVVLDDVSQKEDVEHGAEDGVIEIDESVEIETFETSASSEDGATAKGPEDPEDVEEKVEAVQEESLSQRYEIDVDDDTDEETALADNITEADVYIKYGHMKKAMVHLDKNLEVNPKHIPTHERYLQIFVEEGNAKEQIITLEILAKCYMEEAENEKFDQAVNEILALNPDHKEAQRLLKEGPTALASSAIDDVSVEMDDLNFEFSDAGDQDPTETMEDRQKIELSESVEEYEDSVGELLDEANFYLHQGMKDEAAVIYEKILSLYPNRTDISRKLDLIRNNGVKEAAPFLEEAAPSTEDSDLFAEIAEEMGEDEQEPSFAVETQEAAISEPEETAPSLPDEFVDFANELRQEVDHSVSEIVKETEGATITEEDLLDFSSELRREVEQSIASEGNLFGESDVMEIFSEFREGVQRELDDEDHETHYNLGIAYMEMGLIDEAREEFTIASQDPKRLMDCLGMIGLCYIQKGEYQKALSELEKGVALQGRTDDEYNGLRYEVAKVCGLLGDQDRAVQELLQIHAIDPKYRDVAVKLRELGLNGKNKRSDIIDTQSKKSKVSYL